MLRFPAACPLQALIRPDVNPTTMQLVAPVIANAPNPAGFSILKERFDGATISPLYLLFAIPSATVAMSAMYGLGKLF